MFPTSQDPRQGRPPPQQGHPDQRPAGVLSPPPPGGPPRPGSAQRTPIPPHQGPGFMSPPLQPGMNQFPNQPRPGPPGAPVFGPGGQPGRISPMPYPGPPRSPGLMSPPLPNQNVPQRSLSPMQGPPRQGFNPPNGPIQPMGGRPPQPTNPGQRSFTSPPPQFQQGHPQHAQAPFVNGQMGQGGPPVHEMGNMRIASPQAPYPQQPGNPPEQQTFGESGPAKSKRPPRAYHQDQTDVSLPAGNFGPPDQYQNFAQQQQFQQPQGPTSGPGPQQQQPQQPFAPGRPAHPYANAPPPGPAPPAHYREFDDDPEPISNAPRLPGSTGQRLPGLRNKIDPNQIPSPVAVQEQDQQVWDENLFLTSGEAASVPHANSDHVAYDQGSCNPRFIRLTTYSFPHTDELATSAQMPLAMIVQPFAPLHPAEQPVPTVDFGEGGPPRCKRCRGYVNPFCMFVEGGQKFICNLCGGGTEVSPEYFSNLDWQSRRLDHESRPELNLGSVDFRVPKEYWTQDDQANPGAAARQPAPMSYVFAIDVSWTGVSCGMVKEATQAIKTILYGDAGKEGEAAEGRPLGVPYGAKVAILTFDRTVHFYSLKAELDNAKMLVVPDLSDMFVPLSEGFLVDPQESRTVIERLLDSIPDMFASTQIVDAALGGAVAASLAALKRIGGQLNIFQSSLPTVGPGALKHREDPKVYNTEKEKTLFAPADPFYRTSAEEFVESGVGVNLFLFPSQYIDVATIGVLSGLTGGEVFFYPRFDPVRYGQRLRSELKRVVTRETGYSVTLRIRCSNGLRVSEHFGNFFQRNVTDLEFGTLDADKALAALVKHEAKLDEKTGAFFQCAVLYTSAAGERLVRVHNIAVPVANVLGNVFRHADMDATITYESKKAIAQTINKPLREVREQLTATCTKALLAYRKHCASSTSPGQLILPESFKLYPVYALALMKSTALKGGSIASDARVHYMRLMKSLSASNMISFLYPRLIAIHNLHDDVGSMVPVARREGDQRLLLPPFLRPSQMRLEQHGAYLLDNGDTSVIWLAAGVSPAIVRDLYGTEDLQELDVTMTSLPNLPTKLSEQVRTIVSHFESTRGGRQLPLIIARQGIDNGSEYAFGNLMVEDGNNDAMNYPDYLCYVHKQIQQELTGEKQQAEVDSSSLWRGTW